MARSDRSRPRGARGTGARGAAAASPRGGDHARRGTHTRVVAQRDYRATRRGADAQSGVIARATRRPGARTGMARGVGGAPRSERCDVRNAPTRGCARPSAESGRARVGARAHPGYAGRHRVGREPHGGTPGPRSHARAQTVRGRVRVRSWRAARRERAAERGRAPGGCGGSGGCEGSRSEPSRWLQWLAPQQQRGQPERGGRVRGRRE
mmetsp:Transcript_29945/g.68672  ORF Transcript_29945/g.68672 Transcript_29945/m.68672 type:complete len:209 (+) Transcript_29945:186-812(+)